MKTSCHGEALLDPLDNAEASLTLNGSGRALSVQTRQWLDERSHFPRLARERTHIQKVA